MEEKPFEKLNRLENELKEALNGEDLTIISSKYLELGEFCLEIDAIEYGINFIQSALSRNKRLPEEYKLYELLGHLNYTHGMLEDALNSYKKYIKKVPKGDDYVTQASVLFNMGKLLILLEKYDAAVKTFKESEKLYELHGDYLERAQLLYDIGVECHSKITTSQPDMLNIIVEVTTGVPKSPKTEILKKTAKKSFKEAFKILKSHNLLESERELAAKIQGYLNT